MKKWQLRRATGRRLAARMMDLLRPWVGWVWDGRRGGRGGRVWGLLRGLFVGAVEVGGRGTGRRRGKREAGRVVLDPMEARVLLSAVVMTDRGDYAPGSVALFTATTDGGPVGNFLAGETVRFEVVRADGVAVVRPAVGVWHVTDGATGFGAYQDGDGAWWMPDLDGVVNGAVTTAWDVDGQFANTTERLKATGVTSGAVAEAVFTDSVTAIVVGAQVGTLGAGTAGSVTYVVNFSRSGPDPSYAGLAVTGLPAGVTGVFSATSDSVSGDSDLPPVTLTLTSTTGAVAGTFGFTVSATSPSVAGSGTVVVSDVTAPATATVTNPVNGSALKTVPATFSGSVADGVGGLGLASNSTKFTLRRGDGFYWTGLVWQSTAVNLSTTHVATTGGNAATWTSSVTMPNWAAIADGTITIQVRATDKSGNLFVGTSSFTLDRISPTNVGAVVNDGLSGDATYQGSLGSLSANWSGFVDAGSGIVNYAMSVGTVPGGGQVSGVVNVGNVTSATLTGLNLVDGGTYYVNIRATDAAGNFGNLISSSGVTVDLTAPASVAAAVTPNTNSSSFSISYSLNVSGAGASSVELWARGPSDGSYLLVATDNAPVDGGSFAYTATQGTGNYAFYTRANDVAGNYEGAPGVADTTVVYDVTAPTVVSISRVGGLTSNAASASWAVVLSENVSGVDLADFALVATGVTGATLNGLSGSGTTYTVTVLTGSGDGTLHLNLVDNDSIQDSSNNTLGGAGVGNGNFTAGQDVTIDKTPPTVASIVRVVASPTNAGLLQWTVTFGESVTGVDASDFSLVRSGVSGGSITDVTGSGAVYVVTASTGTGDGTLGLNLGDNDTIADGTGNKLGGTGVNNGNFSGEVYAIDRTVFGPAISGPAGGSYKSGAALDFTMNFGEAVVVTGSPQIVLTVGAAAVNAAYFSGSGTSFLVFRYVVQAGDSDTDGIGTGTSIVLNGGTIKDVAGNAAVLTFTPPVTTGVLVDTTAPAAPVISSISTDTGVSGSDRETGDTTLHLTGTAEAGSTVAVTRVGVGVIGTVVAAGGVWDFDYTGTVLGQGSHSFTATATDSAGNVSAPSAVFTVTVDTTSPVIGSFSGPADGRYGAGQVLQFTVSFGEVVYVAGGVPSVNVTIGGVPRLAAYVSGGGSSALLFSYTVQAGDAGAVVAAPSIALNGATIRDTAGNDAALGVTPPVMAGVVVDGVAPVANSIVRHLPAGPLSNGSTVTFAVNFSEAVSGVGAGNFAVGGTAGAGVVGIPTTDDGGVTWLVPVTALAGATGTVRLDLANNAGIVDVAGNGLVTPELAGDAYTLDHVNPMVASVARVGAAVTGAATVQWTVTFAESVTGVDATDFVLEAAGVVGAAITDVSGSGATYTVTATTGTGNGTLGLKLVDDDSVADGAGNVLGESGAGNGDYSGEAFTVLKNSAPTATVSLSSASPTTNAVLTATATRVDADADDVRLTYVWKVNGVVVQTTVRQAFDASDLTDSFDLSVAGHGDVADAITVEVTPFVGTVSGEAVSQSATVIQDVPTVTVTWAGGAYSGNAFAAGGVVTGFGGVDLGVATLTYYAGNSATGTPLGGAPVHAGTYTVVAHFGGTSEYASADSAPATISIAKAPVNHSIGNVSHVYGATANLAATLGTTIPTGVNGEALTVLYVSVGNTATAAVGDSAITGSLSDGTGLVSDYEVTLHPGTLTVTKATLIVTAVSTNKVYGQTVVFGGDAFSVGGLLNSDSVDGVTLSSAGAGSSAGVTGSPYAISASAATGVGLGNYDIVYVDGALSVEKAHLTVAANAQSKKFGAENPILTAEITGFVNGESLASSGVSGLPSVSTGADTSSGVGAYAIAASVGTLAAANYDFTAFVAGTLEVTRADSVIQITWADGTYTGAAHGAGAVVTGAGGLNVGATQLTYYAGMDTSETGTVLGAPPVNAGTYTVVATYAGDADHLPSSNSKTITIGKAAATIVVGGYVGLYDGLPHGAAGSATGVNGEPLAGLVIADDTFIGAPGGVVHWAFSNPNYADQSGDAAVTIQKAHLMVTADPKSKAFGAENPPLTATITGFVNGESFATSGITGSASLTTDATAASPAGTYDIAVAGNDLAAVNYDFTAFVPGVLTVAAEASTTAITWSGWTYDGTAHGATAVVTGAGGLNTTTDDLKYYSGTQADPAHLLSGAPVNVGTYTVVALYAGDANHAGSTDSKTVTISKAVATVTVSPFTATYSGTAHAATGTAVGVLGEALTGLDLSGTSHVNAGVYADDAWTFVDVTGNYEDAAGSVDNTIEKADALINVVGFTGVYTGLPHGASGTAAGVLGEDLGDLLQLGDSFIDVPGGTAHWSFAGTSNYRAASGDVQIVITRAAATITVSGFSGTYDGQPHGATGSAATRVDGEPLMGLAVATDAFINVPGGLVHWTFENPNYVSQSGDAAVVITKAHLTLTADDKSKQFGQANPTFTAQISGFVTGELLATSGVTGAAQMSTLAGDASDAGEYAINVAAGDLAATNYDFTTFVSGTLTVTQAASVTVIAWNDGTYDGNPHSASATATGAGGLEVPVPTLTYYLGTDTGITGAILVGPPVHVGTYTVVATYAGDINHTGSSASKTITISARAITVTANPASKAFGAADPVLTYAISAGSLVDGDAFEGGLSRDLGETVGNYAITLGSLHLGADYELAYVGSTLTIAESAATVAITWNNATYDGLAHPATAVVSGVGVITGDVTLAYYLASDAAFVSPLPGAPVNAGSYTVVATYAGDLNHAANSASASITIAKANAAISVNGFSGIYDGSPHAATGTAAGIEAPVATDLTALLDFGTSFANAGTHTAHWTFAGDQNYTAASGDVAVVIDQATAAITVVGFNGSYDGQPHGIVSSTATGVTGEGLTGLTIAVYTFTNAPGGVVHWTFNNPNYVSQSGDAAVTISKAHLTVTADGKAKVFGEMNPALTAEITGFVNGETLITSGVTGVPALATEATIASAVGIYDITVGIGTLAATNYDFVTFVAGSMSITQAPSATQITWNDATYDGLSHAASANSTGIGGLDTLVATLVYYVGTDISAAGSALAPVNAGTYTVVATFEGDLNHTGSSALKTITISRAAATIHVQGYAGTYDAAAHGAHGSATGVSGEDLAGLLVLGDSFTNAPGGTAHWVFAGNLNYDAAAGDVAITIAQASATLVIDSLGKIYGTNNPTLTGTLSGILATDDVTVNYDTAATQFSDVGAYAITAALGGAQVGNYAVVITSGSLLISRADQLINWTTPAGITYGTALSATQLNATASGLPGGSAAGGLTYSPTLGTVLNAGSGQLLHVSAAATLNYNAASLDVSIDVAKATLTLHAIAADKSYDGTTSAAVTLTDDRIAGDLLSITYAAAAFNTKEVGGGKSVTVSGLNLSGPASGNYMLASASASATASILPATIQGRNIFYKDAIFDTSGTQPGNYDGAIATDKTALLPGQTATFANYTSYHRGINGVMVDMSGTISAAVASDFVFRVMDAASPTGWSDAPSPTSIILRPGAGANGSTRIEFVWTNGVISRNWLQVTVVSGLAANDVFYFGNAIGDTGNSGTDAKVTAADEILARANPTSAIDPAPITSLYDFNRDGAVNSADQIIARGNITTFVNALPLFTPAPGAGLPVASATSSSESDVLFPIPAPPQVLPVTLPVVETPVVEVTAPTPPAPVDLSAPVVVLPMPPIEPPMLSPTHGDGQYVETAVVVAAAPPPVAVIPPLPVKPPSKKGAHAPSNAVRPQSTVITTRILPKYVFDGLSWLKQNVLHRR